MKTAAIIAELNPLHSGHARLFAEARRHCDALIVVMSGDFVQRGAPAIFDKYLRTEMALHAGADLVLELPVAAAASSAAHFAESGCAILDALGVADELWFGSEEGTVEPFVQAAEILAQEPVLFKEVLAEQLKSGISFPAAREKALAACLEEKADGKTDFAAPNNILALEYVLALQKANSPIRPVTILRDDSGYHDLSLSADHVSATAIRQEMLRRQAEETTDGALKELALKVPEAVLPVYERALKNGLMQEDAFSEMLLYRLLNETEESLTRYADVSGDLANRILHLRGQFESFSSFADLLKSKNTTRTQINRGLLHILLGITDEHVKASKTPAFARLLGMRKSAENELLPAIKKNSRIPLLTGTAALTAGLEICLPDESASRLYEAVRARIVGQIPVAEASRKFLCLGIQ